MRPRTEVALALGLLLVVGIVVGALGRRRNQAPSEDPRRSTFLAGPNGARALSDALTRLGVEVRRFRQRTRSLSSLGKGDDRQLLAFLEQIGRASCRERV